MKILFSHYLVDDDNPPARIVHAVAQELRGLGHEVDVHRSFGPLGPSQPGGTDRAGAGRRRTQAIRDRLWFARAVARNVPMYRRDLQAIQRYQPDVIVARQDAYCVSMALAARQSGVPLVTYADA